MESTESRCLDGLRVLDWTDASGQLAGRILADLGAEVVLVEPPGGDPSRRGRAAVRCLEGQAAGWAARNFGKRSVEIDFTELDGWRHLRRLVAEADVLIENQPQPLLEKAGLFWSDLHALNPRLVMCSVSPYGCSGPRSGERGSDLTALALSGNLFMTGDPERPPVRCSMPVSDYHTGAEAAAAVLMALWRRDHTGEGDHVDVSIQETMANTNVSHTAQSWTTKYHGRRSGAAYRVGDSIQREIWPCKDGHITFALRGGKARIPGLMALTEVMREAGMAPASLLERDWSQYNHNLLSQAEVDEISQAFGAFFMSRTMSELYDLACERRLMLAPANSESEVLASRQLASRDFFTALDAEGERRIPQRFAAAPWVRVRPRLPRLGDCREFSSAGLAAITHASDSGAGEGIFHGLRVLEFGAGAAAPLATRYFADQGATVVKIESRRRPDFLRTLRDDGSGNLDNSLFFACINPNKMSAGLNMKDPRGLEIAKRLVGWADVVVENFAPGVMAKWGLDYEAIKGEFPGLIMASTCLWGQTGPERAYPGFGGQGAALAGFNHLTGWPDGEPLGPYGTITDSLSPRFAVVAITAALLRRARGGQGAHIDVSQVETGVYCLSEWLLAFQECGESFGRCGNRSEQAAPHGIFPVRGEDRWIAIAIHSDGEWKTFRKAIGEPEWSRAPELGSLAGRLEQLPLIESKLAEWTAGQDGDELAALLQRAGLDAAPVADLQDVLADPQLAHRKHFNQLDHPVVGEHMVESIGARFASTPMVFERPAPCLAADNARVFGDLLGMSASEVEQLVEDGVLG